MGLNLRFNPCQPDCPERSRTCHARCEKYSRFHADNLKRNEKHIVESMVTSYIAESVRTNIDKNRRR